MNFIPFVLMMIALISFYLNQSIQNTRSTLKTYAWIEKSHALQKKASQALYKEAFFSYQGTIKGMKSKTYCNHRLGNRLEERAKYNLYSSLKEKFYSDFLIQLLIKLYPFHLSNEEESRNLVQALRLKLTQLEKTNAVIDLYRLTPVDPLLAKKYRDLLENSEMTIPFDQLFFIRKDAQRHPLCFRFAKLDLFFKVIDPNLAFALFEYEKQSYRNPNKKLTKEEIATFLKNQNQTEEEIEKIFALFSFKEPSKETVHIIETDPNFPLSCHLIKKL